MRIFTHNTRRIQVKDITAGDVILDRDEGGTILSTVEEVRPTVYLLIMQDGFSKQFHADDTVTVLDGEAKP